MEECFVISGSVTSNARPAKPAVTRNPSANSSRSSAVGSSYGQKANTANRTTINKAATNRATNNKAPAPAANKPGQCSGLKSLSSSQIINYLIMSCVWIILQLIYFYFAYRKVCETRCEDSGVGCKE